MNALAVDVNSGELLDLHNGLDDIKQKTIRAIGNPTIRFKEDALRMVRACRFAATLNFTIESDTKNCDERIASNYYFNFWRENPYRII